PSGAASCRGRRLSGAWPGSSCASARRARRRVSSSAALREAADVALHAALGVLELAAAVGAGAGHHLPAARERELLGAVAGSTGGALHHHWCRRRGAGRREELLLDAL